MSANSLQIGGDHYKGRVVEAWDVIEAWGLGFLDGTALKYLSRWRVKHKTAEGRIEDLRKVRHYIDKLIEIEQAKAAEVSRNEVARNALAELESMIRKKQAERRERTCD